MICQSNSSLVCNLTKALIFGKSSIFPLSFSGIGFKGYATKRTSLVKLIPEVENQSALPTFEKLKTIRLLTLLDILAVKLWLLSMIVCFNHQTRISQRIFKCQIKQNTCSLVDQQ
ncbi:uncharacterized protein LOC115958135 [Quercus lobata]|uniref:uncharacterized protein LOC115958135 n=1 Tax=Quercus lobata TaxID=97700 RepID=UPI001246212E|nr:uncharacterized protein LOC115958135 [Quercus lobata]